jgi:predicted HicB family RNase H-like nuclease
VNAVFEHRGYIGSAEVDVDGGVLFGKLLYIRDTITYHANTVEALRTAFQEAVDDYLATCAELGEQPDQPLKGSFNVRVGPERHRKMAIEARRKNMGLNDFVCWALDRTLDNESVGTWHTHAWRAWHLETVPAGNFSTTRDTQLTLSTNTTVQ